MESIIYANLIFMAWCDLKDQEVYVFNVVLGVALVFFHSIKMILSKVEIVNVESCYGLFVSFIEKENVLYKFAVIGISGILLLILCIYKYLEKPDVLIFIFHSPFLKLNNIVFFYTVLLFMISCFGLFVLYFYNKRNMKMPLIPFFTIVFLLIRRSEINSLSSDERGSASIETAIIMSVFLFILTGIVYLSFYLHDVVVIRSVCVKNCEKCLYEDEGKDIVLLVKKELDKKLFVIKNINVTGMTGTKAEIKVSGEYEGCGRSLLGVLEKGKYSYSCKAKRNINMDDVYKVKALKRVIKKIEDIE